MNEKETKGLAELADEMRVKCAVPESHTLKIEWEDGYLVAVVHDGKEYAVARALEPGWLEREIRWCVAHLAKPEIEKLMTAGLMVIHRGETLRVMSVDRGSRRLTLENGAVVSVHEVTRP
jgi:hypothetical protein